MGVCISYTYPFVKLEQKKSKDIRWEKQQEKLSNLRLFWPGMWVGQRLVLAFLKVPEVASASYLRKSI
jgi:hypothetical protein